MSPYWIRQGSWNSPPSSVSLSSVYQHILESHTGLQKYTTLSRDQRSWKQRRSSTCISMPEFACLCWPGYDMFFVTRVWQLCECWFFKFSSVTNEAVGKRSCRKGTDRDVLDGVRKCCGSNGSLLNAGSFVLLYSSMACICIIQTFPLFDVWLPFQDVPRHFQHFHNSVFIQCVIIDGDTSKCARMRSPLPISSMFVLRSTWAQSIQDTVSNACGHFAALRRDHWWWCCPQRCKRRRHSHQVSPVVIRVKDVFRSILVIVKAWQVYSSIVPLESLILK